MAAFLLGFGCGGLVVALFFGVLIWALQTKRKEK